MGDMSSASSPTTLPDSTSELPQSHTVSRVQILTEYSIHESATLSEMHMYFSVGALSWHAHFFELPPLRPMSNRWYYEFAFALFILGGLPTGVKPIIEVGEQGAQVEGNENYSCVSKRVVVVE